MIPLPTTWWKSLKSAILRTSADVLGYTGKKNRDWLDESDKQIQNMFRTKRAEKCRTSGGTTWRRGPSYALFLEKLEGYARLQMQCICPLTRSTLSYAILLTGPPHMQYFHPSWWSECFQSLFSVKHNAQGTVKNLIPQFPLKQELDEPPTL